MIHLLNKDHTNIGSFANYSDLIDFINNKEQSRLKFLNTLNHTLEVPYVMDQSRWSFIYYKHAHLKAMYSCTKEPPIIGIEREAFQQELDLIEVYQGTESNPLQIPVNQDTDIETLQRDFCLAYCMAHGYTLSGILGTSGLGSPGEGEGTPGGEDDLSV